MKPIIEWITPIITGYTPVTDYWYKFTEIEADNPTESKAIPKLEKLYQELKAQCQDYLPVEYITELTMVLNHKCWGHYYCNQLEISRWYQDKFYELQEWAYKYLKGEDLTHFVNTLD